MIHPHYRRGQAVYVNDASRAVGVVSSLLSPEAKAPYVETVRAEYRKVADAHARAEADKQRLPLDKARANGMKVDWASYAPPKPTFTGTRVFRSYDVAELVPFIDWTPFFQTWELKGRFPAILEDEKQGEAARQLSVSMPVPESAWPPSNAPLTTLSGASSPGTICSTVPESSRYTWLAIFPRRRMRLPALKSTMGERSRPFSSAGVASGKTGARWP